MTDKLKCDFFHETDGKCCVSRSTCLLACRRPAAISRAPIYEGLTMKEFLIGLGFSALIFFFALVAVSEYNSRYEQLVPGAGHENSL